MKNEIDYNKGAIDKLADDYAKLVEENERLNRELGFSESQSIDNGVQAQTFKQAYEDCLSELTQAKEKIEVLTIESRLRYEKNNELEDSLEISDEQRQLFKERSENSEKIIQSLESKCKGLEEKQIGFAEWSAKNCQILSNGKWYYTKSDRKKKDIPLNITSSELYAIYSQTLLNG